MRIGQRRFGRLAAASCIAVSALLGTLVSVVRAESAATRRVPVARITVCIDVQGFVSRLGKGDTCVGTTTTWSAGQPAPQLCWNNSSLKPTDRTRTVSVRPVAGCGLQQEIIPAGSVRLCADGSTGVLRWPVTRSCAAGNVATGVIVGQAVFTRSVADATTSSTTTIATSLPIAPRIGDVALTHGQLRFSITGMVPDTGNYAVQWVEDDQSFARYTMARATSKNVAISVDNFRCNRTYRFRVFVMPSDWTIDQGHTYQNVTPHSEIFDVPMAHSCGESATSSTSSSTTTSSTSSSTTTTTVPPSSGGLIAFGGTRTDYPFDSVVDGMGNLYTTGYFQGTVDFDPGAGTSSLTSAGGNDMFVSKLDSAGNFVWAVRFGSSGGEIAYGIAVDGSGNVYTTGYFSGTVDFDPGAGTSNLTSVGGGNDVFISKLNSSGGFVWAKSFGQLTNDIGSGVAVDGSGNVYATGYFQNTVDFDPGAGTSNLTSAGSTDVYVSKFDSLGGFTWVKSFGGTGNDSVYEIALDGSGNVYTTGYFASTADFDPGAGVANLGPAGGGADVYVSKLDASGIFVWAKGFGGAGSDFGRAIAVDGSGNVYVTGNFQVTVDFDPGAGTSNLTSAGDNDVFVSKLDSAGNFVWANRFGSTLSDISQSIAVDGSGNVHTTGSFYGSVDFDPGAGTSLLTSAGSDDAFVSKLTSSGDLVWAIQLGGTDSDGGQSVEVDSSGNVRTVCYFSGSADVDPGAGTTLVVSAGQTDVFVWQVNSSGALRS